MFWFKFIANILLAGLPAVISAIAKARRKKRKQIAELEAKKIREKEETE